MKRFFLLSLFLTGLAYKSEAQNKKSNADQNFRICFVNGQYVACDADAPLTSAGTVYESQPEETPATPQVHIGKGSARKSRIQVAFDDPNAPYLGVNSQVNDGVDRNKERNINYMDSSAPIPPSDGGLSNRR